MKEDTAEELSELKQKLSKENVWRTELGKQNIRYEEIARQVRVIAATQEKLLEQIRLIEERRLKSILFCPLFRRKKTLLEKKEQADRAKEQLEEARKQQKEAEANVRFYENEIFKIKGYKKRYKQLEQEKVTFFRENFGQQNTEFHKLEEEVKFAADYVKELREAVNAGEAAYEVSGYIIAQLDQAEQCGRIDLYGGGLKAEIDKYAYLHAAQRRMEDLQVQIKHFKEELIDVKLSEDLEIGISGFMKFADLFFDGILVDRSVLKRIGSAANRIMEFRRKMEVVMDGLKAKLAVAEQNYKEKEEELMEFIHKKTESLS